MSGAAAAAARAEESDALLQKAETRIGKRLDEAIQNQVLLLFFYFTWVRAGGRERGGCS